MCWFYDKQEWEEKRQHKFESHRTPFMKTTLELGPIKNLQRNRRVHPAQLYLHVLAECFQPGSATSSVDASQVVLVQSALMQYCTPVQQWNHFCGCQPGGSGAECSDAILIS